MKGIVAFRYHNIPAFDPVHENSYRVDGVDDIPVDITENIESVCIPEVAVNITEEQHQLFNARQCKIAFAG